jgi:PAS domain S-box-containing protein
LSDQAQRDRPGEAETLLAIAETLAESPDFTEALRQTCRHLARFTGADTISAHVVNPTRTALFPIAAYHVPKDALPVLAGEPLPIEAQGFSRSVFAGEVAWSDDVQHDARFGFPLFRRFPHRSGLIIPLHETTGVVGAFYLVWWKAARRFEPNEVATLRAIGQQVGLLLRNSRLLAEAQQQRAEAEAAESRYHSLIDRVPAGVWRTTGTGQILDANPALVQLLGYPDRAALVSMNSADLYVDRAERDRLREALAHGGVADFTAQLRRADGSTLWARMQVRATEADGGTVLEGVTEDVTDKRRLEEVERQAEALRYVAHLANAAAHEINNPLSVITARLEMLRRRTTDDGDAAKLDGALESVRRIADIIAHMGRITRLEVHGGTPNIPPMLDIRRSSPSDPR